MKRVMTIIFMLIFLIVAVNCFAAGTVTETVSSVKGALGKIVVVTFACVGDAGDGTIPDTDMSTSTTNYIQGMYLDMVIVDPGATAPDAADVLIKDANGLDLLNGSGTNLIHATATQATVPNTDGQNKRQPVRGTLTLDVDNQATVDAIYSVILIFVQ